MSQEFWFTFIVTFITTALPVFLLIDTHRSVARRKDRALGGWMLNLRTQEWTRSKWIPYGTVMMGYFPPIMYPTPPSFVPREDLEAEWGRDRLRYAAEERIALSVMRPEHLPMIVNPA